MRKLLRSIIIIILVFLIAVFGVNLYVRLITKPMIIDYTKEELKNIDCAIVLGAGVRNKKPSPLLRDRLDKVIELYNAKKIDKIIVSGDHGTKYYDEVNVMKNYLIEAGIPSENIFMDHAGFSTYDSIYRAKNVFDVDNIIIVTQEYHLYRALYIAKQLGLKAYGVSASKKSYSGDTKREIREILARDKDFIKCIFKPTSTKVGDKIDIKGSGNITNDK